MLAAFYVFNRVQHCRDVEEGVTPENSRGFDIKQPVDERCRVYQSSLVDMYQDVVDYLGQQNCAVS